MPGNNATYYASINSKGALVGARQFTGATRTMGRGASSLTAILRPLAPLLLAVSVAAGGVQASASILKAADSYQSLHARLNLVTGSAGRTEAALAGLEIVADRAGAVTSGLTETFLKTTRALDDMGRSQGEALRLTETLSKLLTVSGIAGAQASAGMLQLSQAIASGRFQGDEFRSVAENIPPILRILREQTGLTTGELRKMAAQGKITSEVLVNSLLNASKQVDDQFARIPSTVSRLRSQLSGDLSLIAGRIAEQEGVTLEWTKALQGVRDLVAGQTFQGGLRAMIQLTASAGRGVRNLTEGLREGEIQAKAWWQVLADTGAARATSSLLEDVARGVYTVGNAFKLATSITAEFFNVTVPGARAAKDLADKAARAADELRAVAGLRGAISGPAPLTSDAPETPLRVKLGAGNGALGSKENGGEAKRLADLKKRALELLAVSKLENQLGAAKLEGNKLITQAIQNQIDVRRAVPDEIREAFPALAEKLEAEQRITSELEQQQARATELRAVGETVANSFVDGFKNMAREGRNFGDTLKQIGAQLLELAAQKLFIDPFVQSAGNAFASTGANLATSVLSSFAFADGGVFDRPVGLVGAGGQQGVMAEAGPEAIMPLSRGRNGKLGVAVSGGSSSGATTVVFNIEGDATARTVGLMREMAQQVFSENAGGLVDRSIDAVQKEYVTDPGYLRR